VCKENLDCPSNITENLEPGGLGADMVHDISLALIMFPGEDSLERSFGLLVECREMDLEHIMEATPVTTPKDPCCS
jgi:hypothetical protein